MQRDRFSSRLKSESDPISVYVRARCAVEGICLVVLRFEGGDSKDTNHVGGSPIVTYCDTNSP